VSRERETITDDHVYDAVVALTNKLKERLQEKGNHTLVSRHEIQGIIDEEWIELLEALRSNSTKEYRKELLDVAVACVFGVACIDAGKLDW